jgi:hypothetical protein
MSKCLYTVLLGSLLLPLAAHADDPYLKLGVGQSSFDFGPGTDRETGYAIAYGAKYDKIWGLEAGYVYFGRDSKDIFDLNGNPASLKAQAIYLSGTGSMALSPQAELIGKLGLTVNRLSGAGDSLTRTRMMAGLGGLWHFNKEWGASLEYNYFGKIDNLSLSQVTLAAVYKF